MAAGLLLIEVAAIVASAYAIPASVVPYQSNGEQEWHNDASFIIEPRYPGISKRARVDMELECKGKDKVILLSHQDVVIFHTPNYPNDYSGDSTCNWELKGQTATTRMLIICKDFEMEPKAPNGECVWDWLDIDGTRYCGKDFTASTGFYSKTNTVKMSFVSDYSKEFKGFNCSALANDNYVQPTISYNSSCGRVNRKTKIVGGVETEVHEYPWQVGLAGSLHSNRAFCGGSIINEWWILTAVHCGTTKRDFVVAGEHSWSTDSDTSATQKIAIEQVLWHPNYIKNQHVNDVALIQLATPLTFDPDNKVAPVCPPNPKDSYDNVDAIVTGWGRLTQGGSRPDTLQEVMVPTMTNSKCRSYYGSSITDDMICAGWAEGGKDSCQGDSGGPMIAADGSIYRQIGVVSWGRGCANVRLPGVYSRVNSNLEWIRTIISISGSSWDNPEVDF